MSGRAGPDRGRLERPSEAECRGCHPEAARTWAASRHHLSFTNPDFARSFSREPRSFCRNCHAPARTRAVALRPSEEEAERLGVGCLECHVDAERPELVLTGPGPKVEADHAVERREDFGVRTCVRCHEFDFPSDSARPRGTMMQLTAREHRASAFADRSCADCHLPRVGEGALAERDHSLASTRDPEAWRAALEVEARREDDTLVLDLRPVGVGHALPTGDLYRRLELHAELRVGGVLLASRTRYLARHFAPLRRPNGYLNHAHSLPVVDDRLTGPATIVLELEPTHATGSPTRRATLDWWIDYERVDARDDRRPASSTVASEIRLAEGSL